MSNRKKFLTLTIVLLTFSVMCVCPNLDTEYFTRNKPKPTDLVGRYIPTENTLHFVRDEGGYEVIDTSITLSIDGSFEMVNMPDWWMEPFGKPSGEFDSGKGEWSIERQQEWWALELNFNSEDPPIGLTSIPLVGEAPPYKLWFYVGDPDSGDVMIFRQVIAE